MLELFRSSLRDARVIRVGSYEYIIHPICDGVPPVKPELLEEVLNCMFKITDLDCDLIVSPEAMALPLAAPLSLMSGIPYVVVRKRSYGLGGEVRIEQPTGYSSGVLYLNGVKRDDRVVVVDDVLSSGGTLRGIVNALREVGADIVDVVVAVDKGQCCEELEAELGITIKSLVRVEVRDGHVLILD
ncbi:MAG: adenine phosphoribosyltransferase [Euryarchaeota archaeon]|nr:adenine phosphoribosyltransferase [Euryarchaeota archaeon]